MRMVIKPMLFQEKYPFRLTLNKHSAITNVKWRKEYNVSQDTLVRW